MHLLLVRHGRTASNVARLLDTAYPGSPLDEVGVAQARGLVERLAGVPLDAIYTSDLVRSWQTAQPLAEARGLTPVAHAGLREIQAGDHEMSPEYHPYVQMLIRWGSDPDLRMPGGETGREVLDRFDAVLRDAADHERVLAVSHGALIRLWVAQRAPNLPPDFLRTASMDNTVVVELDGHPGQGWRVRTWAGEPFDGVTPGGS